MSLSSDHRRLLANRYRLRDLVGTGAMGQVYRAEDTLLGSVTVAVKFLSHTLLNQKMRERFEQEATVSALLGEKSIHIVRVRDYGVDDNQVPFYVMEFLQGKNLDDILLEPLTIPRFLKLARQICLGLESAHQGITFKNQLCPIVHRDIKPSNIFVLQDPSLGELVKVLDFGIAKLIQSSGAQTHSFMGTLAYCSPEQMEGKELDNRSDIYSLGVMMYEMLTNDLPLIPETSSFGGWYRAHHEVEPKGFSPNLNLPEKLETLIFQCLAKLPQKRPQNVGKILAVLDSLENDQQNSSSTPEKTLSLSVPATDDVCSAEAWPPDKPQQKIVFPYLIDTAQETIVSLCAMLEDEEIRQLSVCTRYNQFLFMGSPHPMLLWITVLHSRQYGPRWLPCYLDLKSALGKQVVRFLSQAGNYRVLLYALNEPQRPKNVMIFTIASNQCQRLQDWADTSQIIPANQPQVTKKLLRQELEKLKPQVLLKLQAAYVNNASR